MPEKMFETRIRRGQRYLDTVGETYTYTTRYGLREVYNENDLTLPTGAIFYSDMEDDVRQIYIRCRTGASTALYHTCHADVYWSDGLGVDIRFLKEAMPEWDAIFEAAHDLAISWRANAEGGAL